MAETKEEIELVEGTPTAPNIDDREEMKVEAQIAKEQPRVEYKYKPGPITNRRCRDWWWTILFIIFWVGMVVVAIRAIPTGNLNRLIYATDSQGNLCGSGSFSDEPYLYYFDYTNPAYSYSRCVDLCPKKTTVFLLSDDVLSPGANSSDIYNDTLCQYDFPKPTTYTELLTATIHGNCSKIVFDSTPILYRCFPIDNSTLVNSFKSAFVSELNKEGISLQVFRDIYNAYPWILATGAASMFFAWCYLVVLQLFTGLIVWATVILVVLSCIAGCFYLWWNYAVLANVNISPYLSGVGDVMEGVYTVQANSKIYLAFAIIFTVFTVLLLLVIFFLRSRISLSINVIKVASSAVRVMPLLLVFPLLKFSLLLLLLVWFVYILLCLSTAGDLSELDLGVYVWKSNDVLEDLEIYYLFGFLWTWHFIIAFGDCCIAGAIGTWYWTRNKKKLPRFIIFRSVWRVIRYHCGSLLFGSFIIALIELIRYLLTKLEMKARASGNAFLVGLYKALQCVLLCFERFMKFINKNAYIEIAVYGYSFCKGCKMAFQLITRNIIRVVAINRIGFFLLFLGRIMITVCSSLLGNYLITTYSVTPNFWVMPLIVVVILSYGIAHAFTDVMEMAINTIFLSFCEDIERNDGTEYRPYYMPKKLQKYVDKESRTAHPDI